MEVNSDSFEDSEIEYSLDSIWQGGPYRLTKREGQVLKRASSGHTDKHIGLDLGISRETVSTYWRRIFAKLHCTSRAEAIATLSREAVSDRENAFKQSERVRELLSFLSEPSLYGIACRADAVAALEKVLERTLSLVGCEYGFIGEALWDSGQVFLKTHAMTNIAWDEPTKQLYDLHMASGLEFRNLNTLFGKVLTQRETLISNDCQSDPRSGGIPYGHPRLSQFLGIPLIVSGELVGMVGLANRDQEFNLNLVEFLTPLTTACSAVILALRAQQTQERIQRELSLSQARLITLLDSVTEAVVFESADRRVQFVNLAFCQMFGIPDHPQKMVGANCVECAQTFSRLFKDPQGFLDDIESILLAGIPVESEVIFADVRCVLRRFHPLVSDHVMSGYVWTYRDGSL